MKSEQGKSCPVCNQEYSQTNVRTKHHVLPRRFFKGKGKLFELCRNCHNKLEKNIPQKIRLDEWEYEAILYMFVERRKALT
jgi:hypothetical protein